MSSPGHSPSERGATIGPESLGACPLPRSQYDHIVLAHGGGGRLTAELIDRLFVPALGGDVLARMEDQAIVRLGRGDGVKAPRLAFTTDAFVVKPVFETPIPVRPEVRAACEMLGLDPLYVANEGKPVGVVPEEHARTPVDAMRAHPLGKDAAVIGRVVAEHPGRVTLRSALRERFVMMILPDSIRFCSDLCSEGTAAQGAELEIRVIPGCARCRDCGAAFELDQPFGPSTAAAPTCNGSPAARSRSRRWRSPDVRDLRLLGRRRGPAHRPPERRDHRRGPDPRPSARPRGAPR